MSFACKSILFLHLWWSEMMHTCPITFCQMTSSVTHDYAMVNNLNMMSKLRFSITTCKSQIRICNLIARDLVDKIAQFTLVTCAELTFCLIICDLLFRKLQNPAFSWNNCFSQVLSWLEHRVYQIVEHELIETMELLSGF